MTELLSLKPSTVNCGKCRACCIDTIIVLIPEDGDVVESYETDIEEIPGVGTAHVLKKKPNGECVYLGKRGCTIHERAPVICKAYDCSKHVRGALMGKLAMPAPAVADAGFARLNDRRK